MVKSKDGKMAALYNTESIAINGAKVTYPKGPPKYQNGFQNGVGSVPSDSRFTNGYHDEKENTFQENESGVYMNGHDHSDSNYTTSELFFLIK